MQDYQQLEDEKNLNQKLVLLNEELQRLFHGSPDSRVIIFVKRRRVAKYLAQLLNEESSGTFKAKECTSTGPNSADAGMCHGS